MWKKGTLRKVASGVVVTLAVSLPAFQPAHAADSSRWVNDLHSGFRLIAGPAAGDSANLRAGIEIRMEPGWHTYWRYPGDSGVPPRFDFSGSSNLAAAKVRFPAPHLFSDETGQTLGYEGSVVFPVDVTAKDPRQPVTLRVKVDYAVCEKLCLPVEGSAELTLGRSGDSENAALAAAEARVPQPVAAAALGLTLRRVSGGAKPLIAVAIKAPDRPVQLFAEGPTPEWALPIPTPVHDTQDGFEHFTFALDGLPPGVDPNKGPFELTFTVVAGQRAYEIKTRLD